MRWIVAGMTVAFAAAKARAQEVDGLRFVMAPLDADGANPMWIYAIAAALGLIILWNVGSRLRHEWSSGVGDPRARNLYLQLRYTPLRPGEEALDAFEERAQIGHLLALKLDSAVFVAGHRYVKGQLLDLDMSSLPGYPDCHGRVQATVVSQRLISGGLDTFLVKVRFSNLDQKCREPLRRYLRELAHSNRYAHA